MSGKVYVLQAGMNFKVGITSGSIDGRIRTLQTGCADKINLVVWVEVGNEARGIEGLLHDLLDGARQTGEWFKLDPVTVGKIMFVLGMASGTLISPDGPRVPPPLEFGDEWFGGWSTHYVKAFSEFLAAQEGGGDI